MTGQSVGKDYSKQNSLGALLQVLRANGYIELDTKIDVSLRNAINHGKIKFYKESGFDNLRFYYTENNVYKNTDLRIYEFESLIDDAYDAVSALLLGVISFSNNHKDLLQPLTKEYLKFDLLAMQLSIPSVICQSIHDTGDSKQLNIEMEIVNTSRGYIFEIAFLLSFIVYDRDNTYEKYMFSFSNERMRTGWVRFRNEELYQLSQNINDTTVVLEKMIKRKDVLIFPKSKEEISLNEVKYFSFPNFSNVRYTINAIADASVSDRKRLRAHLFIGDVEEKSIILELISEAIENLKTVKNPPAAKISHKFGSMEADALYINVYRFDERKSKEINRNNLNFICMVDYNLSGETTIKHGGIPESIWSQLYHEKNEGILYSWRESKYIIRHNINKIGRNEPCSCGSGKKYKKCCLIKSTRS